jgi:hypothetical protein
MQIWLATAICVLFVGEAAWRFVAMTKPGWGTSTEGKVWALFSAVNFLLIALIGGLCLLWPLVSSSQKSKQKKKEEEGEESGNQKSNAGGDKATIAGDVKTLEVESNPKQQSDAVAISIDANDAKPAKRLLVYLTNLKTFLTLMVVTVHTFSTFHDAAGVGIGTHAGTESSINVVALWFISLNQQYFMGAFFLISAYFCPKSLDRKGFRAFVIDKLVRLGGPFLLFSMLLGPVLYVWQYAYAGFPVTYHFSPTTVGPPWFILWLLNFSLIYAVVAQVLPSLHFKMPHPLLLLVLGLGLGGAFYGLNGVIGGYNYLGFMTMWTFGLCIYVPFFIAGIAGGRNDWLRDNVEDMATWLVWCLRIVCVGFWVLFLLEVGQFGAYGQPTIPGLASLGMNPSLVGIQTPVYAVAMTLAIMQLFHQYFNSSPQSKFMKSAGLAAYAVYVIHPWVIDAFAVAYVEILKAAKVTIAFDPTSAILSPSLPVGSNPAFLAVDPETGDLVSLPDSYLWGGWIFVFVLTQLVVWPLAHYFRKLPVMNKMF